MNILVTGGAGYIGSCTVRELRRTHRVVVLDTLEHGTRAALGDAPLVVGSIDNSALLVQLFRAEAIDAVIHFAAYKAAGESMERPERYFENNVCGTLALLTAMVTAGVKHLVFSSTAAVYGTPAQMPVTEDTPVKPENPYGESKLMVEQMLKWFDICHGLRYVALRYFNAAGAAPDGSLGEDWTHALNLVPIVMKAAVGGAPTVKVFGADYPTPDGTAIRDYIHVLDLAAAHLQALDYLVAEHTSNIFNIGTGIGSSVQQVINLARHYSQVDFPVEYVGRRPGDPPAIWADSTKARKVLGWQAHYGMSDIVESAWKWHSTHPHGLGSAMMSSDS